MKQLRIVLFSLVLLAAAAACNPEPIEFNGEVAEAQVVMQSRIAAGDSIRLRLSYSRFFLDASKFRLINNASIHLSVNGSPVAASVSYNADSGRYTLGYIPQPGDQLAITVNVPGHDPVTASTTIPPDPVIDGITVSQLNSAASNEDRTKYAVRFRLHDDGAAENYYHLQFSCSINYISLDYENSYITVDTLVSRDTTYNSDSSTAFILIDTTFLYDTTLVYDTMPVDIPVYFGCRDYLILDQDGLSLTLGEDDEYYEIYFTDANINGLAHDVQLSLSAEGFYREYEPYSPYGYLDYGHYDLSSLQLWMSLTSYSRDLYLYIVSTNQQASELSSLISEPTQIHTNIDGGIGIFAAGNTKTYLLPVTAAR